MRVCFYSARGPRYFARSSTWKSCVCVCVFASVIVAVLVTGRIHVLYYHSILYQLIGWKCESRSVRASQRHLHSQIPRVVSPKTLAYGEFSCDVAFDSLEGVPLEYKLAFEGSY